MTREDFITAAEIAFDELMSPTADVPLCRMEDPMAEGKWSFKELTSHLVWWNAVSIRAVEALFRGEQFDWGEYANVQTLNAEAIEKRRCDPVKRVLGELRITHTTLLEAVRRVPEHHIHDKNRNIPEWLLTNVLNHYRQHTPQVAEWAQKVKQESDSGLNVLP